MSTIKKIKGFNDLFPPVSAIYSRMEQTAREVFSRYGYYEIRVPLLEKTELFARSIGDETDVVQKEMYTFPDRKGRSLTLRPEATASVVRAYIENKRYASESVSRMFTFGPMFRYERPQKGRQRQFHQVNCELLGAEAPQSDAELILMLWEYLQALGLDGLHLDLNSLGCRDCRPAYHETLGSYLAGVDADELCDDCRRRKTTNPLRVLDCKVEGCRSVMQQAPRLADHLCSGCQSHFASVRTILDRAGIPYTINPRLVRGLDYYQRTTFEVVAENIGAQTAVAGGGRYDGLVSDLGGPALPGTGFACGMERLALLLQEQEQPGTPVDFFLAVLDDEARDEAILQAQQLRKQGLAGEVGYEAKSPKSHLRHANKAGAAYCLLLGGQELQEKAFVVKNMQSGAQETVSWEETGRALRQQRV